MCVCVFSGVCNVLFRTCSQTLLKHDQVVALGEPLAQVIPPRGPCMVSRKMAMKDEPNIELRCSRNVHFLIVSR